MIGSGTLTKQIAGYLVRTGLRNAFRSRFAGPLLNLNHAKTCFCVAYLRR